MAHGVDLIFDLMLQITIC